MSDSVPPSASNLLAGVRVIESSLLGPGQVATFLADLGADVIKVEPPSGDYIRADDLADHRRASRCCTCTPTAASAASRSTSRREEGVEVYKDLVRGADVVVEAMRPGSLARLGLGYEDLVAVNPKIVFCTLSGYGATGPYKDLPSHGIAYDTWAGIVHARLRRRGLLPHPRACPTSASTSGPMLRCARPCWPAIINARDDRRGLPDGGGASPTPRRTWTGTGSRPGKAYERPEDEVTGNTADDYERRAPGTGRHARGRPLPDVRVRRRPRAVHGVRAGVLEELLRGRRPHGPVRALAGLEVRRPRPRQPRAPGRAAGHLQDQDHRGVAGASATRTTRRSRRSTRRRPSATTRSSRTGSRSTASTTWAPSSCRCR